MSSAINRSEFTLVGELSDEGLITLDHFAPLKRVLKRLVGKKLEISIRELEYRRTDAQNRYLWGVCYVTICAFHKETTGEKITKEAVHAHTLQHILDYRMTVTSIAGKDVAVFEGKSTSQLNTKEFNELVEKLQAFWGEKGCVIPDPRQNNFLSDFIKDE